MRLLWREGTLCPNSRQIQWRYVRFRSDLCVSVCNLCILCFLMFMELAHFSDRNKILGKGTHRKLYFIFKILCARITGDDVWSHVLRDAGMQGLHMWNMCSTVRRWLDKTTDHQGICGERRCWILQDVLLWMHVSMRFYRCMRCTLMCSMLLWRQDDYASGLSAWSTATQLHDVTCEYTRLARNWRTTIIIHCKR